MAGRRRGSSRAVRRSGPKDQTWTTVLLDNTVVDDNPTVGADLVIPADWGAGAGLERATVLRVRGWLTFQPPVALPSTCFMAIETQDQGLGAAAVDPTLPAFYADEDVVWTRGVSVAVTAAANDLYVPTLDVDVKAMRKITSGMVLRLSMRTNGPVGAQWTVNGVLRTLVRIGGN